MGCTESSAAVAAPELPDYSCSQVLGKGTYGVVFAARSKRRNSKCAVKQIDLRLTSARQVKYEAMIMHHLKHPRIVNLREVVLHGDEHAHLVLDIYRGGELSGGMNRHWETKGLIPMPTVQRLLRMMVQAVDWLHSHKVVHRNLKGENFMLDHRDVAHPECQVFLGDFSAARRLEAPNGRLDLQMGTPRMWAPEVCLRDYGIAADMWALGVVAFQMMFAQFPFYGENEIMTAKLEFPVRASRARTFVGNMLVRDEAERLTARQAMEHDFLSEAPPADACRAPLPELASPPPASKDSAVGVIRQATHLSPHVVAPLRGNSRKRLMARLPR